MINYYNAYGLKIKSYISLPELVSSTDFGKYDVIIHQNSSDLTFKNYITECNLSDYTKSIITSDAIHIIWDDISICAIKNGNEIIVNPSTNLDESFIRFFIMGYAMAILLHQRGMLVLHANAVKIKDFAIAFLGQSGIGKSTTSLSLNKMGYDLLADDILAINFSKDFPIVLSGLPRLKLWSDVIENIEGNGHSIPTVHSNFPKLSYKITKYFSDNHVPLKVIYLLESDKKIEVKEVSNQKALTELVKNTYNIRLFDDNELSDNLIQCAELVNNVQIKSLKIHHSFKDIGQIVQVLEKDLGI